jgi:hypothetical protein
VEEVDAASGIYRVGSVSNGKWAWADADAPKFLPARERAAATAAPASVSPRGGSRASASVLRRREIQLSPPVAPRTVDTATACYAVKERAAQVAAVKLGRAAPRVSAEDARAAPVTTAQ